MLVMDYARPGGVGWGVDWTSPGWDCSGKLILEKKCCLLQPQHCFDPWTSHGPPRGPQGTLRESKVFL